MSVPLPIFSVDKSDHCLLCDKKFKKKDKRCNPGKDWSKFKDISKSWSVIDIPDSDNLYNFKFVYNHVKDRETAFGSIHETCRINFTTKQEKYFSRFGEVDTNENTTELHINNEEESAPKPRARRSYVQKRKCFICDEIRISDENNYNEGGLARCEMDTSRDRLVERSSQYTLDRESRFFDAANRFNLLCSGQAFDPYAIDVFYHKSCYIKYAINPTKKVVITETSTDIDEAIRVFYKTIRKKIIKDKEAFLLHHILSYAKDLSNDFDVDPIFNHTVSLKRALINKFQDEIDFFPSGKFVIVHSSVVNPCEYSIAALQGRGLRDQDFVKTFANYIRKKVQERTFNALPETPEEMIKSFDNGPMQDLFNVIYATMYREPYKTNKDGYAITSSQNISTKIWSIAFDWQTLITRKENSKQAMLGLTVHRLTGSKEVAVDLNKLGHAISYGKIIEYNNKWSKIAYPAYKRIMKNVVVHSSIDNNDGRQETATGFGTTHDTNMTLFQPLLPEEKVQTPVPTIIDAGTDLLEESNSREIKDYVIGQRGEPPMLSFNELRDNKQLEESLNIDIAWSLTNGLPEKTDEKLPLLGSWTAFRRAVSTKPDNKSLIEYLPIISQPPKYDVCKYYLDELNEIIKELSLNHIFVHADEEVYAKLMHIIWKHSDLYKKIFVIIGGFHQLRVRQKTIFKRHSYVGYKDWFVDAGIIAPGSVDKAFGGYHYYRCMRILKESLDALLQFRVEQLTDNYQNVPSELLESMKNLRTNPSYEHLQTILSMEAFKNICNSILETKGKQDSMTIAYIRDISSLLALVVAVRDKNVLLHIEAEREMIKHVFAFDHQNYSRYLSFQHVFLNNLRVNNPQAFNDLSERGMGANYSGNSFCAVHGDLVTEYFNRETKSTSGPFRQGYSTNSATTNKWINTVHIHAKLRMAMRDKVNSKVSSTHKELTDSQKKAHQEHVKSLKACLASYQTNPFSNGPVKMITTGVEADSEIIDGLLAAPIKGDEMFKTFVEKRIVHKSESLYEPIKKQKINTGTKKKTTAPRAVTVLKEDVQAFGSLIANSISIEEAFKYPLTSYPLSLSNPNGTLRQGNKANFRNQIIKDCPEAIIQIPPKFCRWIYDGMALFRTHKPLSTYREWFQSIAKYLMTNARKYHAIAIDIVNDQYFNNSTKSATRLSRGEGEVSYRVHVNSVDQKMLQGKDWDQFFHNGANKTDIINLACFYFKSVEGRNLLKVPLTITSGNDSWQITSNAVTVLPKCNHEEADSRLVFHASNSKEPSVIVSKDTDVFLLLLFAFGRMKSPLSWYAKIDSNHLVDVSQIFDHLGGDICEVLPQFHAITGCDTTAYKFNVGKLRVFKKLMKDTSLLNLIKYLGSTEELTTSMIEDAKTFVQTVMYNGKKVETYVATRIRLYKSLKSKSSMNLPADPNSIVEEIKRTHLQSFIWKHCLEPIIPEVNIESFGWKIEREGVVSPCWYNCNKLPPHIPEAKKNEQVRITTSKASEAEPPIPKRFKPQEVTVIERQSINDYESEWESDFSTDSDDSEDSDYVP